MFRSLLVPLDGSSAAEAALHGAAEIARRSRATLHLVRVHRPVRRAEITELALYSDRLFADEVNYLRGVAARLESRWGISVSVAVEDEPVAPAIAARATAVGADLIVMTTHGRTGFRRAWIGSVADDVVRHAAVPVLLSRVSPEEGASEPAEQLFRDILVPLDGTAAPESIVPAALALGALADACITLLRVVEPAMVPAGASSMLLADGGPSPAQAMDLDPARHESEAARRYLDDAVTRLLPRDGSVRARSVVVVHEDPAEGVLEHLRGSSHDLIAMTTRARPFSRMIIGGMADALLRGTRLPILLRKSSHVDAA
ncbi:MAG TPA: universal stress protein [Gemmatimonadaceae bacterium]